MQLQVYRITRRPKSGEPNEYAYEQYREPKNMHINNRGPKWAVLWDSSGQPTWDPPLCEPGHQMGPNWAAQLDPTCVPTGQPT